MAGNAKLPSKAAARAPKKKASGKASTPASSPAAQPEVTISPVKRMTRASQGRKVTLRDDDAAAEEEDNEDESSAAEPNVMTPAERAEVAKFRASLIAKRRAAAEQEDLAREKEEEQLRKKETARARAEQAQRKKGSKANAEEDAAKPAGSQGKRSAKQSPAQARGTSSAASSKAKRKPTPPSSDEEYEGVNPHRPGQSSRETDKREGRQPSVRLDTAPYRPRRSPSSAGEWGQEAWDGTSASEGEAKAADKKRKKSRSGGWARSQRQFDAAGHVVQRDTARRWTHEQELLMVHLGADISGMRLWMAAPERGSKEIDMEVKKRLGGPSLYATFGQMAREATGEEVEESKARTKMETMRVKYRNALARVSTVNKTKSMGDWADSERGEDDLAYIEEAGIGHWFPSWHEAALYEQQDGKKVRKTMREQAASATPSRTSATVSAGRNAKTSDVNRARKTSKRSQSTDAASDEEHDQLEEKGEAEDSASGSEEGDEEDAAEDEREREERGGTQRQRAAAREGEDDVAQDANMDIHADMDPNTYADMDADEPVLTERRWQELRDDISYEVGSQVEAACEALTSRMTSALASIHALLAQLQCQTARNRVVADAHTSAPPSPSGAPLQARAVCPMGETGNVDNADEPSGAQFRQASTPARFEQPAESIPPSMVPRPPRTPPRPPRAASPRARISDCMDVDESGQQEDSGPKLGHRLPASPARGASQTTSGGGIDPIIGTPTSYRHDASA